MQTLTFVPTEWTVVAQVVALVQTVLAKGVMHFGLGQRVMANSALRKRLAIGVGRGGNESKVTAHVLWTIVEEAIGKVEVRKNYGRAR